MNSFYTVIWIHLFLLITNNNRGSPRGVMAKELDRGLELNEFVLKSGYFVYFRNNPLW